MTASSQLLPVSSENILRDPIGDLGPLPILLLSLLPLGNVEGWIFTRVTLSPATAAWYLKISHFEAVLVGLVILQIFVFSYLTILPLDLSKLFADGELLATSFSRRKRALEYSQVVEQQHLAETMLSILRRLDEDDCLLRTLCELEFNREKANASSYPSGISQLLTTLKRLGHTRINRERMEVPNNVTIPERKVLSEFEDAVLFGSGQVDLICIIEDGHEDELVLEGKSCASRYSLCGTDEEELLEYVRMMQPVLL